MSKNTKLFVVLVIVGVTALWVVTHPPRWWLNMTKSVSLDNPVQTGESLVNQYECRRCHQIGNRGALKAPDLAGVTQGFTDDDLRQWLINPRSTKSDSRSTAMPNFFLSDSEIEVIVAYLQWLDNDQQD